MRGSPPASATWPAILGVDANYHYVDADDPNGRQRPQHPNAGQPLPKQIRPPRAIPAASAPGTISAPPPTPPANRCSKGPASKCPARRSSSFAWPSIWWRSCRSTGSCSTRLGRVEWAWIAAPLIAVAATYVVIRQAQLDIGFVRAQTEIGILELQPDYPRGHLSRYTALYTSLSTTYDFNFDDLTTVAAPFAVKTDTLRGSRPRPSTSSGTTKSASPACSSASNTTNMVHSEQMLPLDGPIRLGKSTAQNNTQIENRSQFPLRSVASSAGQAATEQKRGRTALEGVWIGELRPGESAPVDIRAH